MRGIVKAFRRPPVGSLPVLPRDRNGGFPRLSDGVAHGSRCLASPRHALLAESLGKPSLWVITKDLWYYAPSRSKVMRGSITVYMRSPIRPIIRPNSEKKKSVPNSTG